MLFMLLGVRPRWRLATVVLRRRRRPLRVGCALSDGTLRVGLLLRSYARLKALARGLLMLRLRSQSRPGGCGCAARTGNAGARKRGRSCGGGNGRVAAIGMREQGRITASLRYMRGLRRSRRHVRLLRVLPLLRSRLCGHATGTAVVADLVDGDVVDD